MLDWAEKNGPVKKVRDLSSSSSPAEGLRAMQAATEHEHASALDLDSGMRERLENHFGPMVSRVHFVQSDLPANFGAKALAQGDTVRVAPGAYTPGTASGEHLLSHELGHIVSYMATKNNYFMGFDSGEDHKAGKTDNDILRKSIGHLLKREKNNEYGYSSTYSEAPKFQDYFGDNVNRTFFGANEVSDDEAKNYANHTGFMARDTQNNGQEVFVKKPTYQKNLEKGRNAIGGDPETQAFWREMKVPLLGEPSTRTTPIFDPDRYGDTRSEGQKNLHKLYDMGETSFYGSSKPTKSMAEAVAQVEAKGKGASRVGKQIYKRLWRQLNPDAAYWEYRLRQEKKKNKNIVSKYSKWQ